ncbi:hypothetical protein BS78_06G263000 [Paspalum vaginatum]|nr:hypothetical protein BS78_06G263000 [Paspalum vaginatum]
MGVLLLLHAVLVAMAARAPAAHAWGKEGHYMVCKIAESFLTRETSEAVKELLPEWAGGNLAETCSWADAERRRFPWSSDLHFADSHGDDCKFNYARDGHSKDGVKDMCVVGAINNYTAALEDSSSCPYNQTESLMFLAHFVGDVHQPLHCSRAEDLGGNTIKVHWYGAQSNLHKVWDTDVIETAMTDFYNNSQSTMIEAIELNISEEWSNEKRHWQRCHTWTRTCADEYATESAQLACQAYEGVEQDSILEDDYFYAALPVVQKRIAQGGVRLAAILNKVFCGNKLLHSN